MKKKIKKIEKKEKNIRIIRGSLVKYLKNIRIFIDQPQ
jgi:hypothetical protein